VEVRDGRRHAPHCSRADRSRARPRRDREGPRRRPLCVGHRHRHRRGALVSLGGDVAVAGIPPAVGWAVRIADDHASPLVGPGPVVSIVQGGLASSGTHVRCWTTAGGELHHIVDPRTGRPADTPWRTVTVAAPSCVDANAASTAAIVLGDGAHAWLAEAGLPARLAAEDGCVTTVAGWPKEMP
jgi:FAD:protein FMN transferase